ncbi:MAG: flippase [Dehalococcoidia bacterium]
MLERGRGLAGRLVPDGVGRRIAQNTGWLLAERLVRLLGAFAITVWLVRYLGPTEFGILSYAISVSMIAEVTAGLGVGAIVVRELVRSPEDEAELLGSALALRLLAGLAIAGAALGAIWATDGDLRAIAIVAIVLASVPLRALSTFDQAFQARMQSRLSVTARTAGFAVAAVVKVALLAFGAPLPWFAAAVTLEVAVAAAGFVVLYARTHPLRLSISWRRARRLLADSWPLAIAGAAAMISLRIDQVMLRQMASGPELGMYAAAARLSEVWYFVPVALGTALLPALVATHDDRAAHDRRLQAALDVALWAAVAIAFAVTLLGGLVIAVLYGARFEGATRILQIQVWAGPFVFMGVISGRSLLALGLQRLEAARYVLGAPLNVALNLVLIPRYGATGAAFATLVSYVAVTYVLLLLHPRTRHTGWLMTRALLLPLRVRSDYGGGRRRPAAGEEMVEHRG